MQKRAPSELFFDFYAHGTLGVCLYTLYLILVSMVRVAINGFGRIGRLALRNILRKEGIEVVAINDLVDTQTMAHLLQHDTAYRGFEKNVEYTENSLIVDGTSYSTYSEKDPAALPWKDLNIDIVLECTGIFRTRDGAEKHLQAGAKRVIISAPGKSDGITTFVRGINDDAYAGEDIIDNASCTTNCVSPVMQVLEEAFGVEKAMLTTIHSYTATQKLQDGPHKNLRLARAAAQNLIPSTTGAAIATTRVIPSLEGKFDGMAVRVPTLTVSLSDLTVLLSKEVTAEEVNAAFVAAAKGSLQGLLGVSTQPLVSSDYIQNTHSATVDLPLTKVVGGNLVKIIAWYDNEWGYANRLVDMVGVVAKTLE